MKGKRSYWGLTMVEKHYRVKFALEPYPLQQEIIDYLEGKFLNPVGERYRFFVAALGRQAGKSFLARYMLLERAINQKQKCMWVAPAIPAANGHWQALVDLVVKSKIPTKKINISSKEIHFYGGGKISIRSAIVPDNLRGDTWGFIVLDEGAFYREGGYIWWSICVPMITASGGQILITTTPNGKNWVYGQYLAGQDPTDLYNKSWNLPSTISPYQDKTLLAQLKKKMPSMQWREEFMAEFLSDGGGVFNGVDRASRVDMLDYPLPDREYVMGVDFGGSKDPTAITILDKFTKEQVYGTRLTQMGTIPKLRLILALLATWQPSNTIIEANGIGKPLLLILKAMLRGDNDGQLVDFVNDVAEEDDETIHVSSTDVVGGHRITALAIDNKKKRDMVERLSADIEYGRLFLLKDDTNQSSYSFIQNTEFSTYKRERTKNGVSITYNAAKGSHDDTISALYLALDAIPVARKRRKTNNGDTPRKNPFKNRPNRRLRNA